jgi:hypothetical protein
VCPQGELCRDHPPARERLTVEREWDGYTLMTHGLWSGERQLRKNQKLRVGMGSVRTSLASGKHPPPEMPLYFIMLRYVQPFQNPYLVTSDIKDSVLVTFSTARSLSRQDANLSNQAPPRQPPVISLLSSSKYNPPHVPQIHSLTGLPHVTHVPFFRLGNIFHINHASASSVSTLNRISSIRIGSAYSVWLAITSSWP